MRWNKYEALGLPRNSIRAVLALVLVSALIWLSYVYNDKEMRIVISNLATAAVTYYFASKRQDEKKERLPPEEETPKEKPSLTDDTKNVGA